MRRCEYERAGNSCSSSSVGRNSDSGDRNAGGGSDGGEESEEVQSCLRGPLDTMDDLEDSLPFEGRGISKFYCGKSKSFTTLADVITKSTSAKDLAKPKTPFTKKRKNLLPFNLKDMAKKPNSSKKSSKVTSLDTSSSGSNSSSSEEDQGQNSLLPPPYPHLRQDVIIDSIDNATQGVIMHGPMRSFSMADLRGMIGSSPLIGLKDNCMNRYCDG